MHALLQEAITKFETLPLDTQDAIAADWLEQLQDEALWAEQFNNTSESQWQKLVNFARADIATGKNISLDTFLTSED